MLLLWIYIVVILLLKPKKKKDTFNKRSCSDGFNIEVETDNVVKVTCKICTQYLQQIRVEDSKRWVWIGSG